MSIEQLHLYSCLRTFCLRYVLWYGFRQGANKTLVMREINEESVSAFLKNKEALAPCNVAAFVYDRCVLHYSYCMLPNVIKELNLNLS